MKKIKLCNKYKRYKDQESGDVKRWYEGCGHTISVVKGDIPGESEMRVSPKNADGFHVRGDEKLMLSHLDKNPKKRINMLLRRENFLK